MAGTSTRFPIDAAMMTPKAAKAQQAYVADRENRFGPSFWAILFVLVIFVGVALWALTH